MLPALNHNKSQRPRISLLIPTLLASSHLNDSDNGKAGDKEIAFMRIDCDVIDMGLVNLQLDEMPLDYVKILHEDFVSHHQRQASRSTDNDDV